MSEHFLQSKIWREIKENLGNRTFEVGKKSDGRNQKSEDLQPIWFQTTKIPLLNKFAGYLPRADINEIDFEALYSAAKKANCVYVTIDPINRKLKDEKTKKLKNEQLLAQLQTTHYKLQPAKPIHLQRNILIDLTRSEDELLASLEKKDRYEIKQSFKKGFEFREENNIDNFLALHESTIQRQNFYGRSSNYLKTVWEISKKFEKEENKNSAKVFTTSLNSKTQVSSLVFLYENTIYYTYAGASEESRRNGASYFHVWSILNWARENGYSTFDFWGLEEDLKSGFSGFKKKFGGEIVEYADSVDLVIQPILYSILKIGMHARDKLKFIKSKL